MLVGDPLRVADPRLRDPVGRRADGADLRDQLGRAGALRAAAIRAPCWCSPRPTRTRTRSSICRRAAGAAQGVPHRRLRALGAGRADRGGAGRSTAASSTTGCRGIKADRSGHADLHLGHHRQAQGLPADALEPGLRDPRGQGVPSRRCCDKGERLLVFLPLAHVLARAITIAAFANKVTLGLHQRHQEPGADVRGVQADAGGVGAAGVREGLQHRRAERPQRRQGQDLRDRRQHRDRVEQGTGRRQARTCCCAPSTRCSTGWSTASCGPRSAATATPRSPVARRWARGSATSTAASA